MAARAVKHFAALVIAASFVAAPAAWAQECAGAIVACASPGAGSLALLAPGRATTIIVDPADEPGVRRAAADLVGDLKAIGGGEVRLAGDPHGGATVIYCAPGDRSLRRRGFPR